MLHFLDVGYGDAIIIQLPEGKSILIDGGLPSEGLRIAAKLRQLGIVSLRRLIITHFHKDHAGGLLPILETFLPPSSSKGNELGEVLIPFYPPMEEVGTAVSAVIERLKKHMVRIVQAGETLHLSPSVRMEILHPVTLIGNQNEDSLVFKIVHGKVSFLMTADAGPMTQKKLLKTYGDRLKSDLIKIPHHANESEGVEPFIEAVNAKISILTIGPNPYNAPNPDIVEMYQSRSQHFFRTDQQRNIMVTSDGQTLEAKTEG